ncbi:unnamed protein product [Alopecurus aequalis]
MSTSSRAPVSRSSMVTKTPSGSPLPRRGQIKENIAKQIVAVAAATASVLVCDAGGGGKKLAGGKIVPAAAPGTAKKK